MKLIRHPNVIRMYEVGSYLVYMIFQRSNKIGFDLGVEVIMATMGYGNMWSCLVISSLLTWQHMLPHPQWAL